MFTWELTHLHTITIMSRAFVNGWKHKAMFAPIFAAYHYLGGDERLLVFFLIMFLADSLIGLISVCKRGVFAFNRLGQWVLKLTIYLVCIITAGIVNDTLSAMFDYSMPFLNIIVGMLVLTEALSFLKNLHDLTGLVPPVILMFLQKAQANAHKRLDDMLPEKENDNG